MTKQSRLLFAALLVATLSACAGFGGTVPAGYELGGLHSTSYLAPSTTYFARAASSAPAQAAVQPTRDEPAAQPAQAQADQPPAAQAQQPTGDVQSCPASGCAGATASAEALAAQYVEAVYERNETEVAERAQPSVVDIYRYAQAAGVVYHSPRPAIGDIVFFHNTWDRNSDGRQNDWYTHIGIVESTDESGTISFLAYEDGAVRRRWMNLESPEVELQAGQTLNSVLRTASRGESSSTQRLAGELFAGFANLLGDREELYVMDRWQPDPSDDARAGR